MTIKDKYIGTRPLLMTTSEAVEKVSSLMKKYPKVKMVYLFGSRCSEKFSPEADIDFAIYTDYDFSWDDYFKLYGEVSLELRTDRFDLVWLNRADPFFAYEVVRYGKCIFCSDELFMNEAELLIRKKWRDVRYLFERKGE